MKEVRTAIVGMGIGRPNGKAIAGHPRGRVVALCDLVEERMADYAKEEVSKFDLWWAFGWPHETSVAMARLVFSGLFDRWPDLVVITHHCGGTIPMMEGRSESGLQLLGTRNPPHLAEAAKTDLKERPIDAFRRFHADTASFGSRAAIECGMAFFGVDKMLFATDSPFDPQQGPGYVRATLRAIREMELTVDQRTAILSGNAKRLILRT